MLVAIVNKSTRFAAGDARAAVSAVARQLRYHAAPVWNRHAVPVVLFADESQAPPGAYMLVVFDHADQADALGWHSESPDGQVYGKVFAAPVLDNGGAALTGELSVSAVLSHEVLEAFVDPAINLWAGAGDHLVAVEVGDPVENASYAVAAAGRLVSVSNFVTPAWFDVNAPGHFDWMEQVTAPFEMLPGGYVVTMKDGLVSQQFGETYPAWRRETKTFPAARTARRVGAPVT